MKHKLDPNERKEYNKVTNSGVICEKCNKPVGSVTYVKIFKIKNYLSPEGFERS